MMNTDFLYDRNTEPSPENISKLLGSAYELWLEYLHFIKETAGEVRLEWKLYTKKSPWTMKVLLKKRNLLFFTPLADSFAMTFVFGERAVNAIMDTTLSDELKLELSEAKKYMEGRDLRLVISDSEALEQAKILMGVKLKY